MFLTYFRLEIKILLWNINLLINFYVIQKIALLVKKYRNFTFESNVHKPPSTIFLWFSSKRFEETFAKMTWLSFIRNCLIPDVTHQFFYASTQQSVYCWGQLSKGDLGWPPMLGHKSPIVVHILFLFFDIRSGRKRWV